MNTKLLLSSALLPVLTVVGAAFASSEPAPGAPVARIVPGPAGAVAAVCDLVAALDAGDASRVQELLSRRGRGLVATPQSDGGLQFAKGRPAPALFDVAAADGGAVTTASDDGLEAWVAAITGGSSTVTTVHADCPSGDCSWAVAELSRTYRDADGETRTVDLRASALLEYEDAVNGFRVFHWHVSPR